MLRLATLIATFTFAVATEFNMSPEEYKRRQRSMQYPEMLVDRPCSAIGACQRFTDFKQMKEVAASQKVDASPIYNLDANSVVIDEQQGQIRADLTLQSSQDSDLAESLQLILTFYQNGIVRTLIEEDGATRFRISQEDLPVSDEQLVAVQNLTNITTQSDQSLQVGSLDHELGDEQFVFKIDFSPFRMYQMTGDGRVALTANSLDTLYVEKSTTSQSLSLKETENVQNGREMQSVNDEVKKGIAMGFQLPTQVLFGLGEREDTLVLKETTDGNPYELWAFDTPHSPDSEQNLYGSQPFIQGLSTEISQAVAWVNSAHTWVYIDRYSSASTQGSHVNFVSESGALEFFMFFSAAPEEADLNTAKRVANAVSTITGFATLPPIHTLGFHFSKYAPASSDIIRQRNADFTEYGFPVDVLWMDIQWADYDSLESYYEYFRFNPQNFTTEGIKAMNSEVGDANRRLTVICDPHIKVESTFFVYENGVELEDASTDMTNVESIFVKQPNGVDDYQGTCWPGESVYIDFLNENAQEYWGNLYSTDQFVGSNHLYHAWNDMNEPSVFSEPTKTIPEAAIHIKRDGTQVEHRDFHNAYGAFQQRSTYRGLLKRDNSVRRPFVLTRSFFLGSQKYGAYWTGDNFAVDGEIWGSMKMVLQNSLGGMFFGGADVPGFIGVPAEDVWIRFYQLGQWFPFFRAHSDINNQVREPWLQTQRVQNVIRDSINRRYDFIHYIYTAFRASTLTGNPLMRTMWNEFAYDVSMQKVDTQFMLGDSLLIAPKIDQPNTTLDNMKKQQVTYVLPNQSSWYNLYSKEFVEGDGDLTDHILGDLEQAVFVKSGSILPILLHDDCMSILDCVENSIRVEVYLDQSGNAAGSLYVDDGESMAHQAADLSGFTEIALNFSGTNLFAKRALGSYKLAETQTIDQVEIYGLESAPLDVLQGAIEVPFLYDGTSLMIKLKGVPLDQLAIELVWN